MKLSIDELVSLTGGKLIRSGSGQAITSMTALDEAGPEDVSFLGNEKYYQDYLQTKAGAVLIPAAVPESPAPESSVALIEVENPSFAFGLVVKHFVSQNRKLTPGVHPSAYVAEDVILDASKVSVRAGAVVESGCSIGAGTEIGPGAVIESGVSIGEDCLFYANSTVREGCVIGDRVILQPGCVIGADGYGYELVDGKHVKVDQVGIVVLENDVEIGANTTVDRARFGKTVIGEGTKIDNLVQIAHNVRIGKHCLLVAQSGIAGSAQLGNHVTVAAQSGCTGHVKISDHVVLAAKTAVLKDIKTDGVYMGMPARPIREELKIRAHVVRLPKLVAEVKKLRHRLDEADQSGAE